MLDQIRQLALLDKIFNVHGSEWKKVLFAWMIRFLYRFSFVLGWTVIVGLFVSRYGIVNLPILFVVNAVLTIAGSFIYSNFLDRFSSEKIMLLTVFISGLLLFIATLLFNISMRGFLFLLLVVEGGLLVQFRILMNSFVERMFTSLESERTFPLIESSETIGGIVAGFIILMLVNSIEVYRFVYIWIGLLFLLVPALTYYDSFYDKVTFFKQEEAPRENVGLIKKIKTECKSVKHSGFIKGLFLIVFFQWFLFNLLEYQYTSAVYSNVFSDVVFDAGSGLEHSFVHDLGALFMLFSFSALVVQLFAGSRLINSLGVVGSMILHPIVTLFSLVGLLFNFGFSTAVLAKNNFTITSVIGNNAYHTAYYAVKEKVRDYTRELLEGVVRPIGAIVGTFVLILLQSFFEGSALTLYINLMMIFVAVFLFYVVYAQQSKYTEVAVHELMHSDKKELRANAIDILSQKGHKKILKYLLRILKNDKEPVSLRVRVLIALGETKKINAVKDLLRCLNDEHTAIREAAVDSLMKYDYFFKKAKSNLYLRLKIVRQLKKLCSTEKHERIRFKITRLLSHLSGVSAIEFLMDVLDGPDNQQKAEAILTLGNYKDPDVLKIIMPYLKSKNPMYQISAAIAIGKVKKYQNRAVAKIDLFLKSFEDKKVALAIYAIGELNLKSKKRECLNHLYSHNLDVKIESAVALAKMGYYESVPILVDLLFHSDKSVAKKVRNMLQNVHPMVYKNIDKIVKHIVSGKVGDFISKSESESLDDLDGSKLVMLKWLYCLAEEYDEVDNINDIINP